MVWEDLRPAEILTTAGVRERDHGRYGDRRIHQRHHPSGRYGRTLRDPAQLAEFDEISQRTPMLANIRPSGEFLMEDFYYAGGLRALMARDPRPAAPGLPDGQRKTLGENLDGASLSTTM